MVKIQFQKKIKQPSTEVHSYNPNTWEVKSGDFRVQGQPGLNSNTVSNKQSKPRVWRKIITNIEIFKMLLGFKYLIKVSESTKSSWLA
jgi:hypothetical protein